MLVIDIRGDILNDDTLKPSNPPAENPYPGMSQAQGLVGTLFWGRTLHPPKAITNVGPEDPLRAAVAS